MKTNLLIPVLSFTFYSMCAQNIQWVQKGGGSSMDRAAGAVSVDGSGSSYVTGYFSDTAVFGKDTLISAGALDIFIAKYNDAGVIQWAKRAGGKGDDTGLGIRVGASGLVYVTGSFSDTAMFDSIKVTRNSVSGTEAFVAKYATDGKITWVKQIGGSAGSATGYSICVSLTGNVYAAGSFSGTASFSGTNITSAGSTDMFLVKYNSSGAQQWAKSAGGTGADEAWDITIDLNGNTFLSGHFQNAATFETSVLTSKGGNDVFAAKYNSNGVLQWARQGGGPGNDVGSGIRIDGSGNSYVTGWFGGATSFDTVNVNSISGSEDIFIAKYNTTGGIQWVKPAGGAGNDRGWGVNVDVNGNIYATGSFEGTATFQTDTVNSAGNQDIFIARFNPSCSLQWLVRAGGTQEDKGEGIAVDNTNGYVYVSGWFTDSSGFQSFSPVSAGGSDAYVCKLDNVVGIGEKAKKEYRSLIYPNPASDEITIWLPEGIEKIMEVKIMDLEGSIILHRKIESYYGTISICVNNLRPGIYFLETGSNLVYREKLLILK